MPAEGVSPGMPSEGQLSRLYGNRFTAADETRRNLWRVLCRHFFQRWVGPDDTVLDVAAGGCEFINEISARQRIALDLDPRVVAAAAPGVRAVVGSAHDIPLPSASIDVAFVSNFFEHLERPAILAVLAEIQRLLAPTGRLLVLQPNIRFCARDYWRFFDHITPIDDRALAEAFALSGLQLSTRVVRFLPFTTKSRLPQGDRLVRLYLAAPILWRLFGQQSFLVAVPAGSPVAATGQRQDR